MGTTLSKVESKHFPEFEKELPSVANKVVAITGTSSGLGLVAAKTCVHKGAAAVLLLNRPSDRASKAEEEIKKEYVEGSKTVVETFPCDLQDFSSVKSAATKINVKYEAIDVLCCNAGVMMLGDVATKDGYDVQMQTNHLSHFLLVKELFPLLKRAKEIRNESRVVFHTSMARRGKLLEAKYLGKNGGSLGGTGLNMFFRGPNADRYQQSKLANCVMTLALADRLKDCGIKSVAAAPGFANTNLAQTTNDNGGVLSMTIMRFAQSCEDGTMPLLTACFAPKVKNGELWEPTNGGGMYGAPALKAWEKECEDIESRTVLWSESEKCHGTFSVQV